MRVLFGLLFLYSSVYAQKSSEEHLELENFQEEKVVGVKKIYSFFDGKTDIQDPFSLRDPFKRPPREVVKPKTGQQSGNPRKKVSGSRLDFLETLEPSQLLIKGVFVGKNRRAIVRDGTNKDAENFLLAEGMKLGRNKAEVKAILPGGVIIVEKIVNIYNEVEYLETIIPISGELEYNGK